MYGNVDKPGLMSGFVHISIHFFVNFLRFYMPVSQSELADKHQTRGFCESQCALFDSVDQ